MRNLARYLVSLCIGAAIAVVPMSAHAKKPANKIDFEQILKIAKQSSSVDEFVASLPAEMRRNFALVHSTRNTVQHASLIEPRVILSTNQGNLLIAFSGAQDRPGSDRVEIIQYDEQGFEYRFHTLDFSAEALASKKSGRGSPTVNRNEKSCTQCHHGVPIWDPYSDWPGMYGYASSFEYVGERDIRRGAALEFLESSRGNPRYDALIGLEDAIKNSKLSKKNTHMSLRLGRQQRDRLLGKLRQLPNYPEIRTALIAGLTEYPGFYELFNKNQEEIKSRVRELEVDTASRLSEFDRRKEAFALKVENRPLSLHINVEDLAPSIARFRYVLEHYQIDMGKFSLGFGPESFAINEGNNGREPLLADLLFDATQGNHASIKFKLSATGSTKHPKVRSLFLLMERSKAWNFLDQVQGTSAMRKPWTFADCHDLLKKARTPE